jgi:hypothetical protein
VNAYIIYREAQKQRGESPADHAKFLYILQAQMLERTAADFTDPVRYYILFIGIAAN